jgi:benzoyl-CoA reductase subunit B
MGGNMGADVWDADLCPDVPATAGRRTVPAGSSDFARDRKYVEAQLRELITLCEKVSGKKFDIDRLRETLAYANDMNLGWKRVLELNKANHPYSMP